MRVSQLLLATGRVPNTHDLGLTAAGIKTDTRGYIVVDEGLATSAEGVYALGDCNGRGAFTHTSWNDYEIVANNLFDGASRKVGDRIPIYALFVDPPLGARRHDACADPGLGPSRVVSKNDDDPRRPRPGDG